MVESRIKIHIDYKFKIALIMSQLELACYEGNFDEFCKHSRNTENLKLLDKVGNGLLHICINGFDQFKRKKSNQKGNWLDIMKSLIAKGIDINLKNKKGETPLHFASCKIDMVGLDFLLSCGADVNIKDNKNNSPLETACWIKGNHATVQKLLKHGAHVDQINCFTITSIIPNKDTKTLLLLLGYGLNLNSGLSHSTNCSKNGSCLIDNLHFALMADSLEMARILIESGVDVNTKFRDGLFCIHKIAAKDDVELMELALDKGANVNSVCNKLETPLCWACFHAKLDIVKILLNRGGNPFHRNIKGESLMPYAIKGGNVEIVKILFDLGVPFVKIKDERFFPAHHEFSPLSIAAFFKHVSVFDFLLEKGFRVDEKENNGLSVIHLATKGECIDIVERILKLGVNVDLFDDNGDTPLIIAFRNGCRDLCDLLATRYGANLNIGNEHNSTILESAVALTLNMIAMRDPISLDDVDFLTWWDRGNLSIVKQALRLRAAGIDYSDNTIESSVLLVHMKKPLIDNNKFYNDCTNEIKLMKEVLLNENINLYNFLCFKIQRCISIIRCDKTEETLLNLKPFDNFPNYSSMLSYKTNTASSMKYLFKIAFSFFESLDSEPKLSNDCINVLITYLEVPSLLSLEVIVTGTNVSVF